MIFGGVFSELRDARRAQGKRYALEPRLCAIVMPLMAGANSLRTIEVFIGERRAQLNELVAVDADDSRKATSFRPAKFGNRVGGRLIFRYGQRND